MNSSNQFNNHRHNAPSAFIFIMIFVFGAMSSYLFLDFYSQKRSNLSIMQIIDIVDDVREENEDKNISSTTYKLFINGSEHNFSFSDFNLLGLKLDGITLESIKNKRKGK